MERPDDILNLWQRIDTPRPKKNLDESLFIQMERRSHDVLLRIKRNIILELIASVLLSIIFSIYFRNDNLAFSLCVLVFSIILGFTFMIYLTYLKRIKGINEESILDSLLKKEEVLQNYVKRLKWYIIIISGPSIYFGALLVWIEQDILSLKAVLVFSLFAIPSTGVLIWLGMKYIYALYGKHLDEIREIRNQMSETN